MNNIFDGSAWHGPSVMEIIEKIDAKDAFRESAHIHKICELVQHIVIWRKFAVRRLEGDVKFEVTQQENWKDLRQEDQVTWESIKTSLIDSQEALIKALSGTNDDRLNDIVENKAYDYYTLIHGVMQHDLYHLGEIALLAREVSTVAKQDF